MKKKRANPVIVCLTIRVDRCRLTRVKAHERIYNGKVVKVKTHYRRY